MQVHAFGESHSENNTVEFVPSAFAAYLITENFFPGKHEPYTVLEFQGQACFKMKFHFEIITDSYVV